MKLNGKIDFSNVETLVHLLGQRKISKSRFSLEISEKDCANGIYAALKAEINSRGHEIILDESTKDHILLAARWLIDKEGKPGLFLRGDVGNGKTALMKAIINLVSFVTEEVDGYSARKEIRFITAKEISRLMTTEEGRNEYNKMVSTPMLAIDELGEEPAEVMVYGMIYQPLKELLLERYGKQLFTMITSNLTVVKIKERYTHRVTDRFREMMEVINFTNNSYR